MISTAMWLALVLAGGQAEGAQPAAAESDAAAAVAAAESIADAAMARQSDEPVICVRDGDTLQMNACATEDLSAEDARMQRYLEAAMTRAREGDAGSGEFGGARTNQAAWLAASQRSWAAYADIRCEGVFDQWKGGTIRTFMVVDCKIEAARQRAHDIWADHLTYADSTPPVLPEPVLTVFEEQRAAARRP